MRRDIAVEDRCGNCFEVNGHACFLHCISGEEKWNIFVHNVCTYLDVAICNCCWDDGRSCGSDMVPIPNFEDILKLLSHINIHDGLNHFEN